MIGKHKLRNKTVRGKKMLRCKQCGLMCPPDKASLINATKCPGRSR